MSSDEIIGDQVQNKTYFNFIIFQETKRELFLAFVVIMYVVTGVSPNFAITVACGLKFH